MMFDMKFAVAGADEPMVSKMDEIVFVMEDVDAASSVVFARDGAVNPAKAANSTWGIEPVEDDVDDAFEPEAQELKVDAPMDRSSSDLPIRTISAPTAVTRVRSRALSKSTGDALTSAPISKETKSSILQEMSRWGPEKGREPTLPYRAQLEQFFGQAEVPYAPLHRTVAAWCEKQGAVSIVEVLENIASLCKAVEVKPLQTARLKVFLARTLAYHIRISFLLMTHMRLRRQLPQSYSAKIRTKARRRLRPKRVTGKKKQCNLRCGHRCVDLLGASCTVAVYLRD